MKSTAAPNNSLQARLPWRAAAWAQTLGASMILDLMQRRLLHFASWWKAPATRKDRVTAAFIGGIGCFWIGVLGRIMLGPMPVSFATLRWWALASLATGVVLGVLFPKTVSCVCFPFSMFGVGT